MSYKYSRVVTRQGDDASPLIIISGWAISAEALLDAIQVPNTVTVFSNYNPEFLIQDVNHFLSHFNKTNYDLVAFSLGALWLSVSINDLVIKPKNLCLAGIRFAYPHKIVQTMLTQLHTNKTELMRQFYQQCFSRKNQFDRFMLVNEPEVSSVVLEQGLHYLMNQSFDKAILPQVTTIIHGALDKIAPITDLSDQVLLQPSTKVLNRSGHFIFYDCNSSLFLSLS